MHPTINQYTEKELRTFYRNLLYPRTIEERMLTLLRQGKISKWFSGIGQEAISVGATMALQPADHILPLHRNLGVFTTRNVPFQKLYAQWQGKPTGFTMGRDRSFHFGAPDFNIIGMISHLGAMLGVADGLALHEKLLNSGQIAMAFSGEGGTSEGDFHEALNVAAVWDLPVIFIVENNGYGLSTPTQEQYRCESIVDRAAGYGMKGLKIDGNNVLEVYDTVKTVAEDMRNNPRPVLIECMTFRMRGHEEASGTKYVPDHLFKKWEEKDPIQLLESELRDKDILNDKIIEKMKADLLREIDEAIHRVHEEQDVAGDPERELEAVLVRTEAAPAEIQVGEKTEMRLVDAISNALYQGMEKHKDMVIMGQDIAGYGGVFKVTEGFADQFGLERVRNTPICESAIVGAAVGMGIAGRRSVVEMQFADFVSCAFNQIVNNLAKTYYRWGTSLNVVIRMPTGAGVSAGPFHSQSNEAWFFHVPGLKIVYPSHPIQAKGLLMAALEDPNPVLFFEHKKLYRSVREDVPEEAYTLPIGKARVVSEGSDLVIITYGQGVHWALEEFAEDSQVAIVDLQTLLPWDQELVFDQVRNKGKAILFHEDTITGGIGAEIAASITEHCFEYLDGPVKRVGGLDTPVPLAPELERDFLANSRLKTVVGELLEY
jgi:2-oxoisovalerate dehydrogenase E1 component